MAVEEILSGYLTRSDLSKLYAECGNALHRGTLKTVLSRANRAVPDFHRVQHWLQKIVTLLNHHQISLIDAKHEYWVIIHAEEEGRVHGFLMKQMPAPTKP
jgi:hypothetical protein